MKEMIIKMLKQSQYNSLIKGKNKEYLIFNTYSAALAILDENLKYIYDNIEKIYKTEKNEKDINLLYENGFIVEKEINEFNRICVEERISRYNNSTLTLTIAPTLFCNMKCPYCYEEKLPKFMDKEIISRLLSFVQLKIKSNSIKK